MNPETLYRLAYVVLTIGTSIEVLFFFFYGLELMFFVDDPQELKEIRENFIASLVSIFILLLVWGSNGKIVDWILGLT